MAPGTGRGWCCDVGREGKGKEEALAGTSRGEVGRVGLRWLRHPSLLLSITEKPSPAWGRGRRGELAAEATPALG